MATPVLAAVDGTPDSGPAVRWAAEEAERQGRPLRLVHAWGRPEHLAPALPGVSEVRGRALAALAGEAARVRSEHPAVPVETALLEVPAPRGLLAEAEHAALVVVGTHRPRGLPGLFLGSVGLAVAARTTRCPVVLVPPRAREQPGPVVVGVDPVRPSGTAVAFAAREARVRELTARAVSAWPQPGCWDDIGEDERASVAHAELERLGRVLPGPLRTAARALPGRPSTVLLAASADAALLVLGRSGRRLGPVAGEVCEYAVCPVAIVPDA
ncbi:universal stress protein [Kitasatospora terrestris]|uniref:Universal stress protein n=1 Tax=Kitasatospora terrestris TaxID=258051 RepID=A0ABP9D950_9ACTN